jgi:hypothetical protein
MFILYAIVIGLAVGLLAGGRPAGIGQVQFRWAWLIFLGFGAQVLLFSAPVTERIGNLGPPIYVASTAMVLVALMRNVAQPGLPIVALGALSNFAAIIANGGYMPASTDALATLGRLAASGYSNSAVVEAPALAPLTDIFALPAGLPFANVFSFGDVLIGVGVALSIAIAMRPVRPGTSPLGPWTSTKGRLAGARLAHRVPAQGRRPSHAHRPPRANPS